MKMRPVLKYPGAKWRIASYIVGLLPPHKVYLEPFFGSGAVLFNKTRSKIETVNDVDGNVVNLFKVIRDNPAELARLIAFTPWSRSEFHDLLLSASEPEYFIKTGDQLEDARRFLVRMWMAMGPKTSDRTGWCNHIQDKAGKSKLKQWCDLPERIIQVAERLKQVQIENQLALELIERYRYPEVCIYADPPYMLETRREKRHYKYEMTDNDHIELLELLDKHTGPVVLSGYESQLYNERLSSWTRKTIPSLCEAGRVREEIIWINKVGAAHSQSLFG